MLVAWLNFESALPPPLHLPLTPRQYKRAKAKEKKAAQDSEFCHRFLKVFQGWDESKVVVDSSGPEGF